MMTIEKAYELFSNEKYVENGAIDAYYGEVNNFIKLTELTWSDYVDIIDKNMVNKFIVQLRGSGRTTGGINHDITSVRVFLYWCMANGLMKEFKIKLIRGQEAPLKFVSDVDLEKLMKFDRKDFTEHRDFTIISLILNTGARISTVVNLKKCDLDGHTLLFKHLKNKETAIIPMSLQLEKILKDFLYSWETDSEYMFTSVTGEQLTTGAFRQSLNRYCIARGVKRYGPHALRHTFARQWIINGGNSFMLQHFLTHSDLTMTKRYVKLFDTDLKDFDKFLYKIPSKRKTVRRAY